MQYNIIPVGRNILVKPTEVKKPESGIIIPEKAKDAEQRAATTGTVLAIGELAWDDFPDSEAWAKVGDVVVFKAHTGMRILEDDEAYDKKYLLLMRDVDVAAIQKGES